MKRMICAVLTALLIMTGCAHREPERRAPLPPDRPSLHLIDERSAPPEQNLLRGQTAAPQKEKAPETLVFLMPPPNPIRLMPEENGENLLLAASLSGEPERV